MGSVYFENLMFSDSFHTFLHGINSARGKHTHYHTHTCRAHLHEGARSLSNVNIYRQSSGHVSCTRVNWLQDRQRKILHNTKQWTKSHSTLPRTMQNIIMQYKMMWHKTTLLNTKHHHTLRHNAQHDADCLIHLVQSAVRLSLLGVCQP